MSARSPTSHAAPVAPPATAAATSPIAAPAADWTAQPERSNLFWLRLMAWIARRCGRPVARALLHPITLYFVLCSPAQRRHSRRYLERALGRRATWRDGYRHVHAFASTVLDRVYLLGRPQEAFDIAVHGVECVDATLREGQGAFLIGAHVGSFEALHAVGRHRPGQRIAMLMYPDNARRINQVLAAIAPEAQPCVIALGRRDSMLALRDWLDSGGLAGMLGDRVLPARTADAGRREDRVRLPFLGHEATFGDGPFRLAALLRRRVLFMAAVYRGGARYDVGFEPLADFTTPIADAQEREHRIHAAVAAYAARLEGLCRSAPYNWFNFHDFWADDER